MLSVHLSTARSWRGGENQVYLLADGLRALGQRPVVVAPDAAPLLARCREKKIETYALKVHAEWDIYGAWKLARLLNGLRPVILHLHDGHAILPGKMAARLSGLKHLKVVAHRRTVFKLKSRSKYGRRIDRVVAISHAVKEQLTAADIPDENIRVVYSGIDFPEPLPPDAPEVNALREKHAISRDAFVLAHAGALTAEKRQLDMIAAVGLVNDALKLRGEPGVHLALAGKGELQTELGASAAKSGCGNYVHLLEFMTDLRPLWGMASMAVYASEAEGLCTALIEAQGAGLPAAVSKAGGMVEVVEDEQTGVIFNVGDTRALSQAILEFHDNTALRERMGEKARARARALFSSHSMVEGIVRVYAELTGR